MFEVNRPGEIIFCHTRPEISFLFIMPYGGRGGTESGRPGVFSAKSGRPDKFIAKSGAGFPGNFPSKDGRPGHLWQNPGIRNILDPYPGGRTIFRLIPDPELLADSGRPGIF